MSYPVRTRCDDGGSVYELSYTVRADARWAALEEHVVTPQELTNSMEEWLRENEIPFLVSGRALGFLHADVQVSADARTHEGRSCLHVQAVVLTGFELEGNVTASRLADQLKMSWSSLLPIGLDLERENCTVWANFGWVADAFDPADFVGVLDEMTACVKEWGLSLQTHLGSGVLGTVARFKDPAGPVETDLQARRRQAGHEMFGRLLEHSLGLPRGSIQVTGRGARSLLAPNARA